VYFSNSKWSIVNHGIDVLKKEKCFSNSKPGFEKTQNLIFQKANLG
jgi:hypothetical protein